jgi:uncharacterized protein
MLIQFTVGNFRSIAGDVNFSMEAAPSSKRAKTMRVDLENQFEIPKTKLLKSAVLYGANASGKSNFVQAIRFMQNFVLRSSAMQIGDNIDVSAFRFIEGFQEKPSTFEIIFFASDNNTYRYGFSVSNTKVIEEWLYVKGTARENCLFERDEQKFDVKKKFIEGENLQDKTRDNALFLATVAQFNGEISKLIINWFRGIQILDGTADQAQSLLAAQAITDEQVRKKVSDFIKELDLSIQDVTVEKRAIPIPKDKDQVLEIFSAEMRKQIKDNTFHQASTQHNKFSPDGKLVGSETVSLSEFESEGTKKLFNFAPAFLEGLENQRIFVIDELDAKLHPLLTIALIKMFHANTGSGRCSQLIFTTHDTNLLTSELFRRDQIWFTEKDKLGATQMYSLHDFKLQNKRIRTDEMYEKNYLIGKYGAIPYLGNLRF